MEFFNKAKAVRLRSHLKKYLIADDDEETVRQSRTGSSRKARWEVEFVQNKSNVIRLKGCHGRYLTASDEAFLLGFTGRKVVQTLPKSKMDASTEWQPMRDGSQVKIRANGGKFLRANGGTPPWKDTITHDIPQRTVTQDWVLWSVDVIDITEFESPANHISPASSFSSLPDDFTGSDTRSPSIATRQASSRQVPAPIEDGNERSISQAERVDEASEETNFSTPSTPREKTIDAVSEIPVEQETTKGRSKAEVPDVDETILKLSTPKEKNSRHSDQPDYSASKNPRDETQALDHPSPKKAQAPAPSPSVETTIASMPKKSSLTPKEDQLNLVFSELESIVSDLGSGSTSFSETRMEDNEAVEMSAVPSKEEIRQALRSLKECLVLELSQLKNSRVRAKFILALSTLSIAKGSLSQEQMEAAHHFLTNFNALMMKFDRAERQLVECNNFLRDKNRAYDDLRVINENNLDLKTRIDQLNEQEEELMRKIEEIRGMRSKLVEKRMELGEDSRSALSKWNEFTTIEPVVLSRQKKYEKRRDEIIEDWSNLKLLFN